MTGATSPKPTATLNATAESTATSRLGGRGRAGIPPILSRPRTTALTCADAPDHPDMRSARPAVHFGEGPGVIAVEVVTSEADFGEDLVRTPYRVATTAVALAAVFPFGLSAGVAHADEVQVEVVQQAWYWADKTVAVGPEVLPAPEQATGVPDKDLVVAYTNGTNGKPEKASYLAWDVSAIPFGSTVNRFEFTIALDTAPTTAQAAPDGHYALIACGAVGDFTPTTAGKFADRPSDDCSAYAPGKYDATAKTWTFDVAPYADAWAKGDPPSGIGLLPARNSQVPFQVVLKPGSTVKTVVEYTLPEPVVVPPPPTVPPVVQPPAPVANAPAPVFPVTVPQPVAQPAPPPAAPVVALPPVRPVTPVAKGMTFPSKSGLPGAFWAGALAAIALLGVASLMLGDATVPVEAQRGRTVTRSLRERQAAQRGALPRTSTRVRTV
jgi:hypothetical protein